MSIHLRTSDVQILTIVLLMVFWGAPQIGHAEVLTSDNFRVLDPVISIGAEYSTSSSFTLHQTLGEVALGTSSSATSFTAIAGFLPFPTVTLPVPTATAGDGQASLSWTAASGFLGWTVSGYTVGQSTSSGGPYTLTAVGDVTSATASGLSDGTEYFFIIQPEDFFGNLIGTSTEVSATPVASAEEPTPTPGGGGGPPSLIGPPFAPKPIPEVVPEVIPPKEKRIACLARTDFNEDGRVDIADLSIFLFYLDRPLSESKRYDVNDDGKINIVDVSILFYCWNVK